MAHPFRDVAIVGIANTEQARELPGHDSESITLDASLLALEDAGIHPHEVDAVVSEFAQHVVLSLRLGPAARWINRLGIPSLIDALNLVATGMANTALVAAGGAGIYTDRAATAPWTRPANEFVVGYGLFTAGEFALMARRHMIEYGTTPEQLAMVSATIRNNGHAHPGAVYHGKGPFTPDDILASRMVCDPFHLLDCSTTSEGGCALVITSVERARDLPNPPVFVLGAGSDSFGPSYQIAPAFDMTHPRSDLKAGWVGRRASSVAYRMAGIGPDDVDVAEFYDPFSFEIIRQLEAHGFCGEGEGGPFVEDGNIAPGGRLPVTTDGGTMSFSHAGINAQQLQRIIRGVEQLRGTCATMQVPGAEVVMCTNGGSGALFNDVILLGKERP